VNAILIIAAMVVAAFLIPARFDPAIRLKEHNEKRSEDQP
jgi:hypothetical protein